MSRARDRQGSPALSPGVLAMIAEDRSATLKQREVQNRLYNERDRLMRQQAAVDRYLPHLPTCVANGLEETLQWLKVFTLAVDDARVTYDHAWVAEQLRTLNPPEKVKRLPDPATLDVDDYARTVIGRAIYDLQHDCSPYRGIVHAIGHHLARLKHLRHARRQQGFKHALDHPDVIAAKVAQDVERYERAMLTPAVAE